jgi:hypothetical protein
MKLLVVLIILLSINFEIHKCDQNLEMTNYKTGNNYNRMDMNRKIKSIKEMDEIQKYNGKQIEKKTDNVNYDSFLEMQSTSTSTTTHKLSNKLQAMNRLEHTLRVKMASKMMSQKKKRYAENGKECAESFKHKGTLYSDCTRSKSPDTVDAQKEWCYIKEVQVDQGETPWGYCTPDQDYDKIRTQNQKMMFGETIAMNKLIQKMKSINERYASFNNQCNKVVQEFMKMDSMVAAQLKAASNLDEKINNLKSDYGGIAKMEQMGNQLAHGIGMLTNKLLNPFSFLELDLENMESRSSSSSSYSSSGGSSSVSSGGSSSGSTGSYSYGAEAGNSSGGVMQSESGSSASSRGGGASTVPGSSVIYGNKQSCSSEKVKADEEDANESICPAIQSRDLGNTMNGSGLQNYEEDMSGDGLNAEYYDNIQFLGQGKRQIDPSIDMDLEAYATKFGGDGFSVRWTGNILAPYTGEFTFIIDSSAGYALTVNTDVIIAVDMPASGGESSSSGGAKSTEDFLMKEIKQNESTSNCPKCTRSVPVNLIGGNKYKFNLAFVYNSSKVINEDDPIYIKLFWVIKSKKELVKQKYLFTQNVFNPLKCTGLDPSKCTVGKVCQNDLAFKDSKEYIFSDMPKKYCGSPKLKFPLKFMESGVTFQVNNPCVVYISYFEAYDDPTPDDFVETHDIVNIQKIDLTHQSSMVNKEEVDVDALETLPMNIKMKEFDAGVININFKKIGTNIKSFSMMMWFGVDEFNKVPNVCGGKQLWISNPESKHFNKCNTSSAEVNSGCLQALNGEMRDNGGMWHTLGEGEDAFLQINFNKTYQVMKIEYQDRISATHRVSKLELKFSNGHSQFLFMQNDGQKREFVVDPPQKANFMKIIIVGIYSGPNNGGAFKVWGVPCHSADEPDETPDNVGWRNILGLPPNSTTPIFANRADKAVILSCKDTLMSTKFLPHNLSIGSKILIEVQDSCATDISSKIWGSKLGYSRDSHICKASVHCEKMNTTEKNKKMWLTVGGAMNGLHGSISGGVESSRKRFSKYTYTISEWAAEEEIILEVGNAVDCIVSGNEWSAGRIKGISDENGKKNLQLSIDGESSSDSALIKMFYPDVEKIAACGNYVRDRDCTGSRKHMNTARSVKWIFAPETREIEASLKSCIVESGNIFSYKGNAWGWNRDMTDRVQMRINTDDQRMKSLVQFPPDSKSLGCKDPSINCNESNWSVNVGPGLFNVKIGIGDSEHPTRIDLMANNVYIVEGITLEKGEYRVFEGSCNDKNGFITIKSKCKEECDYEMAKINMVEISEVIRADANAEKNKDKAKPMSVDPCKTYSGGDKCESGDPTDCIYEKSSDTGAENCKGALGLVQVPETFETCPKQKGKFKCVQRMWSCNAQCSLKCPNPCTTSGSEYLCA